MLSGPGFSMDDFEYKFEDCKELQELLGVIEQRQSTRPDDDDDDESQQDNCPANMHTMPLQFQPHQTPTVFGSMANGTILNTPFSGNFNGTCAPQGSLPRNSFDAMSPTQAPIHLQARQSFDGSVGTVGLQPQFNGMPAPNLNNQQLAPQMVMFQGGQHPAPMTSPVVVLPSSMPYNIHNNGGITFTGIMPQGVMVAQHPNSSATALTKGGSGADKVSHSSVEKLRRDRINTLIEELRELVPPSASSNKLDGLESRRPKHVVLADTIALLRNMKQQQQLNPQPAAPDVKPEVQENRSYCELVRCQSAGIPGERVRLQRPSTSATNGSSSDQDDMDGSNGAPRLPVIPMQPNMNRGVSVEKGPDCMYVQVKCKDRRGLLSDIINALHSLSLEVRTASVTTTADGSVRDVFEVMPDADVVPEQLQNMVHDALFDMPAATTLEHKRARSVKA